MPLKSPLPTHPAQRDRRQALAVWVIVATLSTFVSWQSFGGTVESWDVCDPNRKFCGRLTVILSSASPFFETLSSGDGTDIDLNSAYTAAYFLQFARDKPSDLPAYSVVISSDPLVKKWLPRLAASKRPHAGLLGVVSASVDSFDDLLSDDSHVSLIQRAFTKFSEDRGCRDLMRSQGTGDVRPFIKSEIVINAKNTADSLLLLKGKDQTIVDAGIGSSNVTLLEDRTIQRLTKALAPGVIQTFVGSCGGAMVGRKFEAKDSCSCYLSLTDQYALYFLNRTKSFFGASVGRPDARRLSLQTTFEPIPNIASLALGLLISQLHSYTPGLVDGRNRGPIFIASERVNPYQAFEYTSADSRAENLLKALKGENLSAQAADKLLRAGFIEDIPLESGLDPGPVTANEDVGRILDLTTLLRKSYGSRLEEPPIPKMDGTFERDMIEFGNCVRRENPQPEACSTIFELIDIAGRGTYSAGVQSQADADYMSAVNDFLDEFDPRENPRLLSQFTSGKINGSVFFKKISSMAHKFDEFRQQLANYYSYVHHRKMPDDLKAALDARMTNPFNDALYYVQRQLFPFLLKGTLEVRLARIEGAARLLELHKSELKSLDANAELHLLRENLECQMFYPVGPAFDAIKKNSLPAWPPEQRASSASSLSSRQ